MAKRKRVRGKSKTSPQKRPRENVDVTKLGIRSVISSRTQKPKRKKVDATAVDDACAEEVQTLELECGPVNASLAPVQTPTSMPIESETRARSKRDERRPVKTQVQVRAVFEGDSNRDEILNWTPHGVFVQTTSLLSVGDAVVVTFDTTEQSMPLSLTGRVRWVSPFGRACDPRPGMGIAFVGANEGQRRRLASLLLPQSA